MANDFNSRGITIGGTIINPGERKVIELPVLTLYSQTPVSIPVHVYHGKKEGPRLFLIGAIHGDEISGVEIIRRLFAHSSLRVNAGTLIAVPVANILGFMTMSRYLPDRRDLNRAFPGSKKGSLTARFANVLMEEIILKCTHGIDLHSGNVHSENFPHVRTNISVPGSLEMARAFNVPVIMDASLPDGSIRSVAKKLKIPILVYEGGEALRFSEMAIRIGLRGVMNVLRYLGMINTKLEKQKKLKSRVTHFSYWIRAPKGGIFHPLRQLGSDVGVGEKIGYIADPFSRKDTEIFSLLKGIIIGRNTLPLVNEGDPIFHIAKLKSTATVSSEINQLQTDLSENTFDLF